VKVKVKLHAQFRRFIPKGESNPLTVHLPEQAAVKDLFARLGIPSRKAKLIIVNGVSAKPSAKLADGDEIDLFPPVAGG